jgi:hypothetical protein
MVMAKGRDRQRSRPNVRDPFPSPETFDREVRDLRIRLSVLRQVYRREHNLALAASGGSDVSVTTSISKPTETTWENEQNEESREDCRRAVKWLREAATDIGKAIGSFADPEVQPTEPSPDSVVDQSTFERAVNRRRHREREEELRSP